MSDGPVTEGGEPMERWVVDLLEAPRVRVWNMPGTEVFVEGKVIAVCTDPTITIEDDDGIRHHHSLALPVEVEHREWRDRLRS